MPGAPADHWEALQRQGEQWALGTGPEGDYNRRAVQPGKAMTARNGGGDFSPPLFARALAKRHPGHLAQDDDTVVDAKHDLFEGAVRADAQRDMKDGQAFTIREMDGCPASGGYRQAPTLEFLPGNARVVLLVVGDQVNKPGHLRGFGRIFDRTLLRPSRRLVEYLAPRAASRQSPGDSLLGSFAFQSNPHLGQSLIPLQISVSAPESWTSNRFKYIQAPLNAQNRRSLRVFAPGRLQRLPWTDASQGAGLTVQAVVCESGSDAEGNVSPRR